MLRVLGAVALGAAAVAVAARIAGPSWLALWVMLVPWLAVLDASRSWRTALALGLLLAWILAVNVFAWFPPAMAHYAGGSLAVAWAVFLLLAPLLEPQLPVFALVRHALARVQAPAAWRAAIGAGTWVGVEWLWPKLFGDTLGHGLHASPLLRQAADVGGVNWLTVCILLANESALAVWRALAAPGDAATRWRRARAPLAGVLAVPLVLGAYGAWRTAALAHAADGPELTAGLVQAGIAGYERLRREVGTYEAVRRILDRHLALSDALLASQPLDLLVWPETVYPTTFGAPKSEDGAAFDAQIAGVTARSGVPLVFGAFDADPDGREYNAAIVLQRDGAGVGFAAYRKASLFPLTERVPWWMDVAPVRAALPWLGTWNPGEGPRVLRVVLPGGRRVTVGPMICYDAVDPAVARRAARDGADVLLTLSNDSWFDDGADGPRLHLVMAAFRSIETRRPQLRVTNTGVTAVVDAGGEIGPSLGVGAEGTIVGRVRPAASPWTVQLAWGDWVGPAGLAVAVAGLALAGRRRA